MKKVLVVPGDNKACGYYRMIQPATVLNIMSNQIKCIISPGEIIMVNDMDILYIQRCCSPTLLETLSKVKNTCTKLKIFIDFDDLIFTSNVGSLPDYNLCRNNIDYESNGRALRKYKSIIDKISVSTVGLKNILVNEYMFDNSQVCVIPNMLTRHDYHWPRFVKTTDIDRPRVLLAGSNTHYDPKNKLYGDFPIDMVNYINRCTDINVMGQKPFFINEAKVTPWIDMYRYPLTFLQDDSDFVIAPLKNNVFNRCKSNLKMLETCAAGKVFIGSYFKGSPYEDEHDLVKLNESGTNIGKIIRELKNKDKYNEVLEYQYKYINGYWLENNYQLYEMFFDTKVSI